MLANLKSQIATDAAGLIAHWPPAIQKEFRMFLECAMCGHPPDRPLSRSFQAYYREYKKKPAFSQSAIRNPHSEIR